MNSTLRVLSIFGTRPEAVKIAPVVQLLSQTQGVESRVCVTAQHREMLDQVLSLFGITPDIDLDLMETDQELTNLTAAILTRLDPVLEDIKPDWVLIQGDTTTVMAAAVLAYYHRVKVGHIEAGLRTDNKWAPFPEEINRRIAGVVADLHFAPTEQARQNLLNENIPAENILVTGNPVIDALQFIVSQPFNYENSSLAKIPWDRRIVLVTAHRRENFGEPLKNICLALCELAQTYREQIHIVYPIHLNPNVQEPVRRLLGHVPNIDLLPPLDYLSFVNLMKRSTLVLTDSGGLQEEGPGLGKPVLVLREVTERPEGIASGTVRLVGTEPDRIFSETRRLLEDEKAYLAMAQATNPYGDGHAAERIVQGLLDKCSPV